MALKVFEILFVDVRCGGCFKWSVLQSCADFNMM